MNWKLILGCSLFGMAMAIATVYWIPMNMEWLFWLIIFLVCAYLVAKNAPGKFFLHGFMVSIFNCIWITAAHYLWFETYTANHPDVVAMMNEKGLEVSRASLLKMAPVVGIATGLVLGLFSFIAAKVVKRR